MKYAIIISKKDTASLNIYEALNKLNFKENIYVIQDKSYEAEDIDKRIDADFFIFATKHSSESLRRTLTVHNPGNWTKSKFGGESSTLPPSKASMVKHAFLTLKRLNNSDYEVSGEATHHGPFLTKPSLFIEIGSSMIQWKDSQAAEIIAKTIVDIVTTSISDQYQTAIALGGGHYMPSFNKVLEKTNIALAYICPKHNLQHLNEELLQQAIKNSTEKIDFILLDYKGLGPEKDKVKRLTENLDIPIKRIKEVLKESKL